MTSGAKRGRKAKYGGSMVRTCFTLPDYMHRYLQDVGKGNTSEGIREVIRSAWLYDAFMAENTTAEEDEIYGLSVEATRARALRRVMGNPHLTPFADAVVPPLPDPSGMSEQDYKTAKENLYRMYVDVIYAPEGYVIELGLLPEAERAKAYQSM